MIRLLMNSIAVVALVATAADAGPYFFTTFDVPGGTDVRPTGINNLGQVAGSYLADEATGRYDVFLRDTDGTIRTFALPNGRSAQTHHLNDRGQLAGLYTLVDDPDLAISYGYVFDLNTGAFESVAYPAPGFEPDTAVTEVSNDGTRWIGWRDTTGAFDYRGWSSAADGSNFADIDGPTGGSTFLWGMNDAGLLVGRERRSAFILDDGTFTSFQVDGLFTTAFDVNNRGEVIGTYFTPGFANERGFIYRGGVIELFDAPGATDTDIFSINDAGTIVGSYLDASGNRHAFIATVVPEPSSIVLAGISGIALIGLSRRRLHARGSGRS